MPLAPHEAIEAITKAVEEAKSTIRDLHAARADALGFFKAERERFDREIREAIAEAIADLEHEARAAASTRLSAVVDEIRADLRGRLGLS